MLNARSDGQGRSQCLSTSVSGIPELRENGSLVRNSEMI
jgi:hypothetical protein